MRASSRIALVLLILLSTTPLFAQGIAISPKVSTLGAGLDLTVGVAHGISVRAGAQTYSMDREMNQQDIDYNAELELESANLFLDLHPGGRSFHFTLGGIFNNNQLTAISTEDTIVEVNNVPYRVADVGVITADVTTDDIGPYVGIGWGNPMNKPGRWTFTFDLGAFYQGDPIVDLNAVKTGTTPFPPGFEANLAAEEAKVQEDFADYKIYPVVSFGLAFRF